MLSKNADSVAFKLQNVRHAATGKERLRPTDFEVRKSGQNLGDFGAGGVVGLDVDELNGLISVDNQYGGPRQVSRPFGVDFGQVETKLALGGQNVVGLLEGDTDASGHAAARVREYREGQVRFLCGRKGLIGRLRADGNQPGAKGIELGEQFLLIGAQRQVAVRAPAAAIEHDHRGSRCDELVEADRLAGGVVESKRSQTVADLDGLGRDTLSQKMLDAAVEHFESLGRESLGSNRFELVGLFANRGRHYESPGPGSRAKRHWTGQSIY